MRRTSSTLPSNMPAFRTRFDTNVLLWLTLAVVVAYANALTGDFLFDDFNVIVNTSQVHTWQNWFANLGNGIRPLLKFSYTLNWTMGTGVAGFHLLNLLIHLANVYLVYRLANEFVRQQLEQNKFEHVPLFAALLFAVHPIHTEAVTYICGRSSALMALFYLAGVLCYVLGRTRNNNFYLTIATPLLFLLALGVKETAVTFPFALLLWEIGCGGKWQRNLKLLWPSWLLLLMCTLFFLFSDSYLAQMQRSVELNSLQGNIATQLSAFNYLLQQWVLPLGLNIDPDMALHHDFSASVLPVLSFVALVGVMSFMWRKRPWISFALAWAMLHLIPLYVFLPRIDIANERQLYLVGWPLFLALVIELKWWLGDRSSRLAIAALFLCCLCLTLLRNQVYDNEIALWEDTVLKSPNKARVHNNLGYAYLQAKRYNDARQEFTCALKLDPRLYQAHYNPLKLDDAVADPANQ